MNEQLKVVISAEIDKLKSGCKDAEEAVNKFNDKTSNAKAKIKESFSAIGKGAVEAGKFIAKGIAVGATALAALGTAALKQYADYEQLVGGVETLFKDSAGVVQKYANDAYQSAGLTANQYMETVTSFSASLLQSLGGDTAKAAEAANTAVIDMADNANKMGTSIESIQSAYQGFAKQNYTMLDNLKLGYGGTKSEMERLLADAEKVSGIKYDISNLNDVYSAIHIVQTELGITGTTAKEASTTISGSLSSMKGAWSNLVAGLMNDNADIDELCNKVVESALTVLDNIAPKIQTFLPNVVKGVSTLVNEIVPQIPTLLNSILPSLVEGAVLLINGVVQAAPQLIDALLEIIPPLVEGVLSISEGIISALPEIVTPICEALPSLIGQLLEGILNLIVMICENFSDIIQPIIAMLPDLITTIVTTLLDNLPALINGVIQLVVGIVGAVGQIIEVLVPMIPTIIAEVVKAIVAAIPTILAGVFQIVNAVVELIASLVKTIIEFFKNLWKEITNVFKAVSTWFNDNVIKPVVNFFKGLWTSVSGYFKSLWSDIKNIFLTVANWFNEKVIQPIITKFNGLKEKVCAVWQAIKDGAKVPLNGVIGFINGFLNGIQSAINWVVSKLNLISFDIPDWVPVIGGKTFGFNLSEVSIGQIPLLENGGILNKPTLNIAGEHGAEAIVPLENNTEWIDKLVDKLGFNGSNSPNIVLQVDGKTFGKIACNTINDLTRQKGKIPLVLV